jgi:hypothetical protein
MTMKRRLESLERLESQRPQPAAQDEIFSRDRLMALLARTRASMGLPPGPVTSSRANRHRRPTPAASDTRTAAEKLQAFLAEAARARDTMEDNNDP